MEFQLSYSLPIGKSLRLSGLVFPWLYSGESQYLADNTCTKVFHKLQIEITLLLLSEHKFK